MTSCDRAADRPDEATSTELRLSSGVELETESRAAFTSADVQIRGGESVAVWVDEIGGAQLYGNNILTADGSGGLSGGARMFFPENGQNVDIYALHTNATITGEPYPSTSFTHSVSADQRTIADYAASDMMYARTTNVAKTSSAIGMTFYHLLSKIQIAVRAGNGLEATDIKGVTITGVRPEAVVSLDKSTAPAATTVAAAGTATDITVGADVSETFDAPVFNDAIIVPQTLTAGTAFITVHLAGGDLTYRLPTTTVFASGKKYIYRLTANLNGITLSSTLAAWSPINPVDGNAVME
jgi:hypothetical protein